jgi:hypothetical protein
MGVFAEFERSKAEPAQMARQFGVGTGTVKRIPLGVTTVLLGACTITGPELSDCARACTERSSVVSLSVRDAFRAKLSRARLYAVRLAQEMSRARTRARVF